MHGAQFPLTELGDAIAPFTETAALMANLDVVVCCDSAPAHLAGALGLPTWVALPHSPDWRWLLDREDTPWYPTMRLFRQKARGDWAGVSEQISAQMRGLLKR
jgi:ADP-heptose:LPS heptosyltransferase